MLLKTPLRIAKYAIAFQKGQEHALAWFFNNYYPLLYLCITRLTNDSEASKEIVSGAFYKIWIQRQQFNTMASMLFYLYIIVHHDTAMFLQKEQRVIRFSQVPAQIVASPVNTFKTIVQSEVMWNLFSAFSAAAGNRAERKKMTYGPTAILQILKSVAC